jgi:hypothetical protein
VLILVEADDAAKKMLSEMGKILSSANSDTEITI